MNDGHGTAYHDDGSEFEEEPGDYWPEDCAECHAPRTHAEERAFGELCGDCAD